MPDKPKPKPKPPEAAEGVVVDPDMPEDAYLEEVDSELELTDEDELDED